MIVFGGVRRETSWMIDQGDKPERWGWLFINYRGYGLSGGEPSERVLLEDAGLIYDYAGFYAAAFATGIVINAAHILVIGPLVWRQGRLRVPGLARA